MSDERMSEEEFARLDHGDWDSDAGALVSEARRARTEESRLAARVEVLEAALRRVRIAGPDEGWMHEHNAVIDAVVPFRTTALSAPSAPKETKR